MGLAEAGLGGAWVGVGVDAEGLRSLDCSRGCLLKMGLAILRLGTQHSLLWVGGWGVSLLQTARPGHCHQGAAVVMHTSCSVAFL